MVFIRNLIRLTYILTINYFDKIAILYLPYYRLRPNKDATITKTSAITPTILQYQNPIPRGERIQGCEVNVFE